MTVLSIWENEPTLCSQSYILWPTHTWKHKSRTYPHKAKTVKVWMGFFETVASAHEETCHSGQAYTHLPSGEETSLKVIVGQKCCLLVVCFLAFLPNLSSLFLALMKQTSHSTLCLLLHTCQILPTRPRINRQGLIGPWKLKIFEK